MVLLLFVCQCLNAKCKQTGTKLLGGLIFSICDDEVSIYLSGCPYTLVCVHILKWVSIKSGLTVCQTSHFAVPVNKAMAGKPYFDAIYHAWIVANILQADPYKIT